MQVRQTLLKFMLRENFTRKNYNFQNPKRVPFWQVEWIFMFLFQAVQSPGDKVPFRAAGYVLYPAPRPGTITAGDSDGWSGDVT